MKETLIIILLITLNLVSLTILFVVLYTQHKTPVVIQNGLQTYFDSNYESIEIYE
jgi:hypothetical protein